MTTGGWIFGSVMMVLLIVLVVIAIVWLVRSSEASKAPTQAEGGSLGSPREVLDRRLAAGEIDEDEYRQLRAALDGVPAPVAHSSP